MTVYRRPDPIPLRRSRPAIDLGVHAVRGEQEDLHRLVSRQIFAAIISGAYPEGSILPNEEVLSQELGVSRTALRESVKGLVAKGILETKRRRGTLVLRRAAWNMFDPDVIAWLRRVEGAAVDRELFEMLSVALFGAAEATATLRASIELKRSALCRGDMSLEARAAFMAELGYVSANRFISSAISNVLGTLLTSNRSALDARTRQMTASWANNLLSAIQNGEVDTAVSLMRLEQATELVEY